MRNYLLFITALLWFFSVKGQTQTGEFKFDQEDVKPGRIVAEKTFSDSSLWGYMDGGADLYQEYGVKKLTHQEIVYNNVLYRANIYEMRDSAAAFGILSVSMLNCQLQDTAFPFACLAEKQVQFCSGRYYVSITNIRGGISCLAKGTLLARCLQKKATQPNYVPPGVFLNTLLFDYLSILKVIYGPLGLQNGYPDWSFLFENMNGYYITMLPLKDSSGSVILARIFFEKPHDMDFFRTRMRLLSNINPIFWKEIEGSKIMEIIKLDDQNCLFLETRGNHHLSRYLLESFEKVGMRRISDPDQPK